MKLIKFTEIGKSYTPRASISKTGLIGLNNGARKRFNLDNYTRGVLYFDEDSGNICIELTTDVNAVGAQKIRFRPTGADIAGRSFLSFFGIEINETLICPINRDEETGFLFIDRSCGVVRGKPKKRSEN